MKLPFSQISIKGAILLIQKSIFPNNSLRVLLLPLCSASFISSKIFTTSENVLLYILLISHYQFSICQSDCILIIIQSGMFSLFLNNADFSHLLHESFYLEDELIDLYLYPHEIKLVGYGKQRIIPLRFGVSFRVIRGDDDPDQLQLYIENEEIKLIKSFWPMAMEWERVLLRFITRKDFHAFFKHVRQIGKGNFASVYLDKDMRYDCQFAVKTFQKEILIKNESFASLENEIKILRRLEHPNLIKLYGVYQSQNSLHLTLQYAKGITLRHFLNTTKEVTKNQRRKIIKELLLGLIQLARLNIVHRDLKPQNMIISPDCQSVKIVDFGFATDIHEPSYLLIRCGTPGYIAPQILKIQDNQKVRLGTSSDIFSLGVIYFELIYRQPLFKGQNNQQILQRNRGTDIALTYKQDLIRFDELKLLQNMLLLDPNLRISPQNALIYLNFLQNNQRCYSVMEPMQSEEPLNFSYDELT